ncbi:hypothetical protein NL676_008312 [Syzygium grande]|nr:hypothetical protein NL676_008312 [Syzygium grande]
MSIIEDSFGYLDAPIERITGADVPMPYAANLERMALPQEVAIVVGGCCCDKILPAISSEGSMVIVFDCKQKAANAIDVIMNTVEKHVQFDWPYYETDWICIFSNNKALQTTTTK